MSDFKLKYTAFTGPWTGILGSAVCKNFMRFMASLCLPRSARRLGCLNIFFCASGFTLLELLMVITILSSVAWMAVSSVADNTNQVRYEDTFNRLDAIREAIVGSSSQKLWEKGLVGGYVADNGRLPEKISDLVTIPTDDSGNVIFEKFNLLTPIFDPTPDSDEVDNNTSDEILLTGDKYKLMKGHRGVYLHGIKKATYRDGWGNKGQTSTSTSSCPSTPSTTTSTISVSDLDDENFGWCVSLVDSYTLDDSDLTDLLYRYDDIYIDSYGLDGEKNQATGDIYEIDTAMTGPILSGDWQVDINGYDVIIENRSDSDVNLTGVKAAILIFVNDGDMDKDQNDLGSDLNDPDDDYNSWITLITNAVAAGSSCLDGDGDSTVGCTDTSITQTTVSFSGILTKVPIGEHIIVLVSNSGTSLYPNDLSPYFTKVKFYPRGGVPEMVLTIR